MERIKELYNTYLNFKDNPKIPFSMMKDHQISKDRGCYIIFDKEDNVIYIGRSKKIKNRLNQHRGADSIASSFRRKIQKRYGLEEEKSITDFIIKNCSFIFVDVNEKEEKRFEHFLIALLNPKLND